MKKVSDIQKRLEKVRDEEQSVTEESHKLKEELKAKSKDQKGQEVSNPSHLSTLVVHRFHTSLVKVCVGIARTHNTWHSKDP